MKESNIFVSNVANNSLRGDNLLNTKGQYMKESNIPAGNATIKQQQKEASLDTKRQYMMDDGVRFPERYCNTKFEIEYIEKS